MCSAQQAAISFEPSVQDLTVLLGNRTSCLQKTTTHVRCSNGYVDVAVAARSFG